MAGVGNFFDNFNPIFHQFFVNNRTKLFFQRNFLGSLDNTFLHKPCKFEQNRSSGIREIFTTGREIAENRLPVKNT